ncbi:MAG TPA: MerR family DNA-binding transcriptional regulator [Pilimelia sp.]|nr:MerR family DNA-binding transcriptional regulator [Pilimelia sp.]
MRGIGQMARETGLTVSALRFYDRAGLLVPAAVDPRTGYRRYAGGQVGPARVVAGLRRVGMPLAQIAAVLAALPDARAARRAVDAHLRRLEDGLADARRALSRVHDLLDTWEAPVSATTTRVTVAAAALAAAVDAVRFAVGRDPALPALGGVLLTTAGGEVELVGTDRFRLATARAAATVDGPPVHVVAPTAFVDEVRARLGCRTAPVVLTVTGSDLAADVAGHQVVGAAVPGDYPDHRRALRRTAAPAALRRATVDVPALRAALAPGAAPLATRRHAGVTYPVVVLAVGPDGAVEAVAPSRWDPEDAGTVAVNPEFLLEALDAGGAGPLVLELDGPIRPLAVRTPGDASRMSVLMPVRL